MAAAALAIPALRYLRETLPPAMRVEIATPVTSTPLQFALSPDGRSIVLVASGDGRQRLRSRLVNRAQYAVARDGRFLINQPVKDAAAAPITLLINWNPDAKT